MHLNISLVIQLIYTCLYYLSTYVLSSVKYWYCKTNFGTGISFQSMHLIQFLIVSLRRKHKSNSVEEIIITCRIIGSMLVTTSWSVQIYFWSDVFILQECYDCSYLQYGSLLPMSYTHSYYHINVEKCLTLTLLTASVKNH